MGDAMANIKVSVIIPVWNQENLIIRALESIPSRKDIEIIVIDDGSTDDTWNNMINYRNKNISNQNLVYFYNNENRGVAYTVNKGYDNATGEYVVLLGSDDYFYNEEFQKAMDLLDGTDLVYFDLETNDGIVFKVDKETSRSNYVGSVKFMRRDFIGNTRCPIEMKAREDYYFYQELLKKQPTEKFTNIIVKHYNFPRSGSLTDKAMKGEI